MGYGNLGIRSREAVPPPLGRKLEEVGDIFRFPHFLRWESRWDVENLSI